jgi:hypothetical protein
MYIRMNIATDFIKSDGANIIIYSIASIIITIVLFYILFKVPKDCYTLPPESTDLRCTSICDTNELSYKKEGATTEGEDGEAEDVYINYTLKDFYIKSAYNCCSIGSYKNCNVSLDMLKYVIRQGIRLLDFAIYSIDGQPIVATSSLENNTKTTYNYLYFSDILEIIHDYAFSSSLLICPNPSDPIFIHLRLYSTSTTMIKNLGDLIQKYTSMFLNTKYSFGDHENNDKIKNNFGNVYLKDLKGKAVLFVQQNKMCYDDRCPLYEYINMTSGSDMLYGLSYYYVENTRDMEYLTEHNKQFMTIVFPDIGDNPPNPNVTVSNNFGCQFTCMRYQLDDSYLKQYNTMFNQAGYAFALKPDDLRYHPRVLAKPIPQNPAYSYAPRSIQGSVKGTSFEI